MHTLTSISLDNASKPLYRAPKRLISAKPVSQNTRYFSPSINIKGYRKTIGTTHTWVIRKISEVFLPYSPPRIGQHNGQPTRKPNEYAILRTFSPGRSIGNRSLILIVVRIVAILRNGQWGVRWRGLHLFSPHKKITFILSLLYKSRTYDDLTGYLRIVKITSRQHLILRYGDKYGEKTANMVVMLGIA